MPSAAPIRVLLFARYAELVGRDTLELAGESLPTVRAVLARLRELPGASAIPAAPLVAVNLRQVGLDAPVVPGDEVAVLPPLAGG
jgi:molybdopterin converting factor small subunit